MKKFFTVVLVLLLSVGQFFGQGKLSSRSPEVEVEYVSIKSTKATLKFTPNSDCAEYAVMFDTAGSVEAHVGAMGLTLEDLIFKWGITYTGENERLFKNLIPKTKYCSYVCMKDSDGTVYPVVRDTVSTTALGGPGLSTIELDVQEIKDSSVRFLAYPNDQTALYFDGLIPQTLWDSLGADSCINIIKGNNWPLYDNDDHHWFNLNASTAYKAIAVGQNVNGEWGEVAILDFSTAVGLRELVNSSLLVYPQPSDGHFTLKTTSEKQDNADIVIYDMQGRSVYRTKHVSREQRIDVGHLSEGRYILSVGNKRESIELLIQK